MQEIVKLVFNEEHEQPVVSSRQVAEDFGKEHRNVLRDIDAMKDVLNFEQMFYETQEPDSYGRRQRTYLMNRDGFTLLAMGFTGSNALEWKLKYIDAFNKMETELNSPERIMARALKIADKTIQQLKLVNQQQEQQIAELQPKADYVDKILRCKDLLTVRQIAQDYGMTATAMNRLLHDLGVQYKQSGQWFLYSKYVSCGYTKSTTYMNDYGMSTMYTKWTQKGRLFLYELLKDNGVLPLIEREDIEQAA